MSIAFINNNYYYAIIISICMMSFSVYTLITVLEQEQATSSFYTCSQYFRAFEPTLGACSASSATPSRSQAAVRKSSAMESSPGYQQQEQQRLKDEAEKVSVPIGFTAWAVKGTFKFVFYKAIG